MSECSLRQDAKISRENHKTPCVEDIFVLNVDSLYFSTISTTYAACGHQPEALCQPNTCAKECECMAMFSERSETDPRSV